MGRVIALVFLGAMICGLTAVESRAATRGGELEIRVVDHDSGAPLAARMHLRDARGKPVRPPKLPFWHDHFALPGKLVLELRPGKYTFELERGPEFRLRTGHFVVSQGAADNHEVTMERFADMKSEGWWSGDLHIHRPLSEIELLMQAEDLHVAPVITWWNDQNPWATSPLPDPLLTSFDENRWVHRLAGEDERGGGALLYFNLPAPLPIAGAQRESPGSCEFLRAARGHADVHVDAEKPFWWDFPVWVASGMVDSVGICHNHLQRDGMLDNEAWGKPRDRFEYPPPHGNGRWTLDIYYRLLNAGLRLPPSAGSGSGVLPNPVGYNRVYVHCGSQFDYARWWENLRAGRVVVTNGPLIRDPRVNGELPGHVFRAAEGQTLELQATLNLSLRERVEYLEIVRDGETAHQVRLDEFRAAAGRLPKVRFERSGWLLVRAVTDDPKTFRFASTGPFYVEIGEQPRISRSAAQFFLDWVYERARGLELPPGAARDIVLKDFRAARDYWKSRVDSSNSP